MSRDDSTLRGKILLDKRTDRERAMALLLEDRARLEEGLKQVDKAIAAHRAYIRELDIRSGKFPDDRRLSSDVSIARMISQVLEAAECPLGVSRIRRAIETRFGRTIPRTSISPVLTKMFRSGKLRHEPIGEWTLNCANEKTGPVAPAASPASTPSHPDSPKTTNGLAAH